MKNRYILGSITLALLTSWAFTTQGMDVKTRLEAQAPQVSQAPIVIPNVAPKHFNGAQITPQTILTLAPQAPEQVSQQTKQWLSSNPALVSHVVGFEPLIGPMKPFHGRTHEMLKKMGQENMSHCNYVLKPIDGHVIKIAGHVNRKESVNMLAGDFGRTYQWGRLLTKEDYEAIAKGILPTDCDATVWYGHKTPIKTAPKTQQTTSRMFYYLLFLQAKKQLNFEDMVAPKMYLVRIPGRPAELSDRNYVIVEEYLEGLKPIESLTAQEEHRIKTVLASIGLFCCSKDNLKRTADGKIVFVDFEQPNNSNPRHFPHKVDWVFRNNANAGLEDFEKHFTAKK